MPDFQLKIKELVSQISLTDFEFQSHTFETTKGCSLLMEEEISQWLNCKILKDHSNPLEPPEFMWVEILIWPGSGFNTLLVGRFIGKYRLYKEAFVMVLDILQEYLALLTIPWVIRLTATLRFLAERSYQKSVGNNSTTNLCKSTVSVLLSRVLKLLQTFLCPQWI